MFPLKLFAYPLAVARIPPVVRVPQFENCCSTCIWSGAGTSSGKALGYGLDGPDSIPVIGGVEIFFILSVSRLVLGYTQPPIKWVPGAFPKAAEHRTKPPYLFLMPWLCMCRPLHPHSSGPSRSVMGGIPLPYRHLNQGIFLYSIYFIFIYLLHIGIPYTKYIE